MPVAVDAPLSVVHQTRLVAVVGKDIPAGRVGEREGGWREGGSEGGGRKVSRLANYATAHLSL